MYPPAGHKLLITEDGSPTLFNEAFNEACHSTSGASLETQVHYLQGCQIEALMQAQPEIHILEVGFGTGLGWRETLKLKEKFPDCFLHFYSLELTEELVRWALPEGNLVAAGNKLAIEFAAPGAKLKVIIGDARQTLLDWGEALPRFDAIYQDAFSPRRNPTLWTTEWFKLLGSLSKPGARLSTYSASTSIRKALIAAGFGVTAGEAFARKKSSTRARWQMPSDENLLMELAKHPIQALSDAEIS